MKIFHKPKTTKEILKELAYTADAYINQIYIFYNMDSDIDSLINITNFLKKIPFLSDEEFMKKIKKVVICKQEFSLLHALINGERGAVDGVLENKNVTVKSEDMDDFVKFMKKSTKTRLEKAIEKFEELIEEKSDKKNFKN
jgi:hypothetical protein